MPPEDVFFHWQPGYLYYEDPWLSVPASRQVWLCHLLFCFLYGFVSLQKLNHPKKRQYDILKIFLHISILQYVVLGVIERVKNIN